MSGWECLDHESVPGEEEGVLYLMTRGEEFVIHVDGRELMGNQQHGSEDALANLACDRLDALGGLDDARVLVGGLGMGFTLAAVLARIGATGQVTVAELVPAVVRWSQQYVGAAAGHPLSDPRAKVFVGDVGDLVEEPPQPWHAILLDVDNGPHALTRPDNHWLYTPEGLAAAKAALTPGGVLGIWSAAPDPKFTTCMRDAGFATEEHPVFEYDRPTPEGDGLHMVWMGTPLGTGPVGQP